MWATWEDVRYSCILHHVVFLSVLRHDYRVVWFCLPPSQTQNDLGRYWFCETVNIQQNTTAYPWVPGQLQLTAVRGCFFLSHAAGPRSLSCGGRPCAPPASCSLTRPLGSVEMQQLPDLTQQFSLSPFSSVPVPSPAYFHLLIILYTFCIN